MNHEVQLLSDGDGIAVIGDSMAVERFLGSTGLPSRDLGLPKLSTALRTGAGVAEAGSTLAANSGRWIKLTEKSAQQLKDFTAMKGSTDGVSRAITMNKGRTNGILEYITKPGPGSMLTNPAVLAGAAGLMAQVAMQQTMDEITDYLAAIDAKVDDVLRAQRDAVVADMIGVDFVIEEAMTIREQVGLVSEVTWSKVQATSATIARTQAYALLQLDALAEKLERKPAVPDLAKTSKEAEAKVQEWLAVLARCFQLQDAIAVLELDRVLDASPDELDRHRIGLRTARQNRRELIARSTERLMARMDAAAGTANAKVLLHPSASKAVVNATNQVAGAVVDFQGRLGIESGRESLDAKRWTEAATEAKDKVLATGAEGVDVAKRVGGETLGRAKSTRGRAKAVTGRFSSEVAGRALSRRRDDE
jgi:hypothetical protein